MIPRNLRISPLLLAATLSLHVYVDAQSLRLRQVGSNSTRITARVGETITLEVFADLQSVEAAGVSFFVTAPDPEFFQVNDFGVPGQSPGTQPFVQGPLFSGAQEPVNLLLPEDDVVAGTIPGQQLDYQAIIGAGSNRNRSGSGVIATFSLLCLKPIEGGKVHIDDNPVRETRLYLSDGLSTERFLTVQGIEITVVGLQLLDIPDVVLLPGQTDSVRIGSLDRYISYTLSPIDSIRWSFTPTDLENLEVTIDPITREVRIVPLAGWTGRQQVVWTATEAQGVIVGEDPLSASEVSDIVVNNPPEFVLSRGPDGVRRDTVVLVEDRHTFVGGDTNPDLRDAFRGDDLDLLVNDLDIGDSDTDLGFLVVPIGVSSTEANVLGDDDPTTHDLLIWSRSNFSGIDSLHVIVQDAHRARDTLRVIVKVVEVPDAPRFILQDAAPRIKRGGTKRYRFSELVEDSDTELDSLIFFWLDDPEEHFVVDTTRVDGEKVVEISGDSGFGGVGQVQLFVGDPFDQVNLQDQVIIFITSAEALPPAVIPSEIKIDLTSGGTPAIWELDLLVEDPDNDDDELGWEVPDVTNSQIGIDQDRIMQVGTPLDFIGYEEVGLTVVDPENQVDILKLRIYSSDGRPVTGGLPDIILDRGEENREFDLDNYYFDADNQDAEMVWQVVPKFDSNNLTVHVDPLTHSVAYFAPEDAGFSTEVVIFRVTDPAGMSAQDTVLVTIKLGGEVVGGEFEIGLLPSVRAPVGELTEVLDLDEFLTTSPAIEKTSISWEITRNGTFGTAVVRGSKVKVFAEEAGLDTLEFTAVDSLGRTERALTTVRFFGENEVLNLRKIPDVIFVVGHMFTDLLLSGFIMDSVTHPDSVVTWSVKDLQPDSPFFVRINEDATILAISTEVGETEVVFTARNVVYGLTASDTVRVIALDPNTEAAPLEALPEVVIISGKEDSSVTLNDFIPPDITPSVTNWLVSGQSVTNPFIDPDPPHVLRVSGVGERVGVDTLSFVVDLGSGSKARGDMVVRVIEAIDETTMNIEVVPNPLNTNFLDVFVMARRALESSPTVVWSFESQDSSLALRQIEENLAYRGVLIWAGGLRLPAGAEGRVLFSASALTTLGSTVQASVTIVTGTAASGKALALTHGAAKMTLPADAVASGTTVIMQSQHVSSTEFSVDVGGQVELQPVGLVNVYPAGLRLDRDGRLAIEAQPDNVGIYQHVKDEWRYFERASEGVKLSRLGQFVLMRDQVAPSIELVALPDQMGRFEARIKDGGSGFDRDSVSLSVDGKTQPLAIEDGYVRWLPREDDNITLATFTLRAGDHAGNVAVEQWVVARVLPTRLSVGVNFPNPFNPETSIPLHIPTNALGEITLSIYNVSGQRVRTLFRGHLYAGSHVLTWDGKDDAGQSVGSGVYLCRLVSGARVYSRRMTFLK